MKIFHPRKAYLKIERRKRRVGQVVTVQAIRNKLQEKGITASWTTLRKMLSVQQRVTAVFRQRDGKTLNIRKATVAENNLQEIYEKLGISATPGGIRKLTA